MSSGLDISKYATPQVYLLRQMEADVCLMLVAAKPADLPSPLQPRSTSTISLSRCSERKKYWRLLERCCTPPRIP